MEILRFLILTRFHLWPLEKMISLKLIAFPLTIVDYSHKCPFNYSHVSNYIVMYSYVKFVQTFAILYEIGQIWEQNISVLNETNFAIWLTKFAKLLFKFIIDLNWYWIFCNPIPRIFWSKFTQISINMECGNLFFLSMQAGRTFLCVRYKM